MGVKIISGFIEDLSIKSTTLISVEEKFHWSCYIFTCFHLNPNHDLFRKNLFIPTISGGVQT